MGEWEATAIAVIDPNTYQSEGEPSNISGKNPADLQPEDFDAHRVADEPANRGAAEDNIFVYSGSEHSERPNSSSPGPSSRTRSTKKALHGSQGVQTRGRQGKPLSAASTEGLTQDNSTGSTEESMKEGSDDDEQSAKQISVIIEELSDRLRDYRAHGTTLMGVCDSLYAMTRRRRSPEVLLR